MLLKCSVCTKKLLGKFFHRKGNGYRDRYKSCARKYHRQHYLANKQSYIDRAKATTERLKAIVDAAKNVPCTDCGIKYPPYVMDFDHIGTDKLMNVSILVKLGNEKKLRAEIKKCEPVCANCHRIRTHSRV